MSSVCASRRTHRTLVELFFALASCTATGCGSGDAESSPTAPCSPTAECTDSGGGDGGGSMRDGGSPSINENWRTTLIVPGGTFPMGRSDNGADASFDAWADEQPEHLVTVSEFALDGYEVTVGRFRQFVSAYDAWRNSGNPIAGSGAHPSIAGTGWQSEWDARLPADSATLESKLLCGGDSNVATWTARPGSNELLPQNCVTWYEAFAFCIWDGGRLPTEAEWEYASAGGSENRLYPWGATVPGADGTLAVYAICPDSNCADVTFADLPPVGSAPQGNAKWGHADLAGSMWEWTLDWYGLYSSSIAQTNPVDLTTRVLRGGSLSDAATNLRAARRFQQYPFYQFPQVGARCARTP